jgi:putative intracellular protease/amidase
MTGANADNILSPATGYDRVVVPGPNGPRELTRRQFEELPLRERVGFLIAGTAEFYRKGAPVTASNAMKG